MTNSPTDPPGTARSWKPLDARQRRVLGVLVEKAKTTPAGYPMSVNAIVAGCNQKNNRDPIASYDAFGVEKALDELRNLGAVSEIDWMGRVSKYKHHAYEWLGVNKVELAVIAELLLRGPQTLGDLRGRASRMEPIADLGALKPIVDALLERGLMIALTPPGRGQIVTHNAYTAQELSGLTVGQAGGVAGGPLSGDEQPTGSRVEAATPRAAPESLVAELSAEIAELRAEIAQLRMRIGDLEAKGTT